MRIHTHGIHVVKTDLVTCITALLTSASKTRESSVPATPLLPCQRIAELYNNELTLSSCTSDSAMDDDMIAWLGRAWSALSVWS